MVSVWGVLRNYHAHAAEMGSVAPEKPQFFLMPESALALSSPSGEISVALAPDGGRTDHEVEMVVRIGANLEPFEMAVGCDSTDRTVQSAAKAAGRPWVAAKGYRGAAVVGTWAPYREGELTLELAVNGEVRQRGSTSKMVHTVEALLTALDERFALSEGDIIFTGTPAGVGVMKSGDVVEAKLLDEAGNRLSHFSGVCTI